MAEQQTQECKCFVAVRVRGTISALREARETLDCLGLVHTNHAVIVDSRPAYKGMLQRAHNYITWGEATKETIAAMLKQRGKQTGGKPLTDEYAQKVGYQTLDELAEAIVSCKVDYNRLDGKRKVFRLHPPKKGYKGKTKQGFNAGGEAGYRGEAINELVKRMV